MAQLGRILIRSCTAPRRVAFNTNAFIFFFLSFLFSRFYFFVRFPQTNERTNERTLRMENSFFLLFSSRYYFLFFTFLIRVSVVAPTLNDVFVFGPASLFAAFLFFTLFQNWKFRFCLSWKLFDQELIVDAILIKTSSNVQF